MKTNERKDSILSIIEMTEELEVRLDELASDARNVARICRAHGGHVEQQGRTLEYYFANRLRSFIEGYEQFKFDILKATLKEELEEINAGVYDEAEGEETE